MLGHKLVQVLGEELDVWATIRGPFEEVAPFDIFHRERTIKNVDVTDLQAVRAALEAARPHVVINAAGVVKQLPTSQDIVQTLSINSIFPHQLAELSEQFGFRLILMSTDCVFDGKKGNYTEEDTTDALDLYGQSKHFGEVVTGNCLTLRASIIGRELSGSHSLVEWFLSNRGKTVRGFTKAIYTGFPTIVFADIITRLILDHPDLSGLYHVSSEPISKFRLLTLINEYYRAGITVEPSEDPRIDRSLDSTRFRAATGFAPQSWELMVQRMAADETPYEKLRQ